MAVRKTIIVSSTPGQNAFTRGRTQSSRAGTLSEFMRAAARSLERGSRGLETRYALKGTA